MLSEGHRHARRYPVVMVWSEANIIRQRHANRRQRDAAVQQMVIGSLFDKAVSRKLQKLLNTVADSD